LKKNESSSLPAEKVPGSFVSGEPGTVDDVVFFCFSYESGDIFPFQEGSWNDKFDVQKPFVYCH